MNRKVSSEHVIETIRLSKKICEHPNKNEVSFYVAYSSVLAIHARTGNIWRPVKEEELILAMSEKMEIGKDISDSLKLDINLPAGVPTLLDASKSIVPKTVAFLKKIGTIDSSNRFSNEAVMDYCEIERIGLPKFIMQKLKIVDNNSLN